MLAGFLQAVQLAVGYIVAHQVAAVVAEPELAGPRVPIETHGVAHAPRHQLQATAVGVHAMDGGVDVRVLVAEVARRAHRDVKLAVGTEGDELPAVVGLSREVGVDHLGFGG
ncbi:hypothetical protein D3C76_1292420 [compost metagenome]